MSNKKIDKIQCMNNIYALAKEKNIPIKQLEANAGVSVGYISKLMQFENKTLPNIDLLYSISQDLGVSIGYLIRGNTKELNKSERKAILFIQQLIQDTENQDIKWEVISETELKSIDDSFSAAFAEIAKPVSEREFISDYYPQGEVFLSGKIVKADIGANRYIYFFPVSHKNSDGNNASHMTEYYELYIIKYEWVTRDPYSNEEERIFTRYSICNTEFSCEDIRVKIEELRDVICNANGEMFLENGAIEIIDDYLGISLPF